MDNYIGERACRIEERIIDRNKRKKKSQFLRHVFEMEHQQLWHKDFEIIASNYHSSFKRKISEALFVQEKRKINSVTAM